MPYTHAHLRATIALCRQQAAARAAHGTAGTVGGCRTVTEELPSVKRRTRPVTPRFIRKEVPHPVNEDGEDTRPKPPKPEPTQAPLFTAQATTAAAEPPASPGVLESNSKVDVYLPTYPPIGVPRCWIPTLRPRRSPPPSRTRQRACCWPSSATLTSTS